MPPWPCILVALAGLVISGATFHLLHQAQEEDTKREYQRRANAHVARLKNHLQSYQEILLRLRTLFVFSDEVTPQEFDAAARDIMRMHRGIQALQWVQRVAGSSRAEFEQSMRTAAAPDGLAFAIRDKGEDGGMLAAAVRDEHLPITFTAPYKGNERALGFDLAAGPTVQELALARDTATPVISRRVSLVQDSRDLAGLIMIIPVYADVVTPESVDARRATLRGYVQGVFFADEMLAACFPPGTLEELNLAIFDSANDGEVIYGSASPLDSAPWRLERILPIYNRLWTLVFTPTGTGRLGISLVPWLALIGGLSFTALFTAYLATLLQRTQKVEMLVQRRTQQVERMIHRLEQEVRERKEREASLRESEGRYRSLFDLSPEGIVVVRSGEIVDCNRAWQEMIGLEEAPPTDRIADRVDPADHEKLASILNDPGAEVGAGPFVQLRCLHADGSIVETEAGAALIVWSGKAAAQLVLRDCSARLAAERQQKELQDRFQEAQKLESLGILAGGIAHDFNNLLTGVIGNASLIRMELPGRAPVLEMVEAIEASATRAADLCRQLLAYSGRGKILIQPVSLTQIVEESTALLHLSISRKASLRFDLDENLPAIMADVTQMRQVVMNLLINASDALDDKPGTISVKTELVEVDAKYLATTVFSKTLAPGTYATLEVSDSGHGMDAETQKRIFEPFFTTKFTGRGLGLSAVLGIIRSHGGTLKVYSERGRGSTFKMLLPICAESPLPLPGDSENESFWRGSGTVLLIDDEAVVRAVMAKMLDSLGFEVLEAEDGVHGLEIFARHAEEICLTIVDLTMPRLDGFGTFRELRRIRPGVRVVLTSGFNEHDASSQFYGKGLSGFVQKPFRMESLRNAVRKALEPED